jgi:hypothetical protein
VYVESFSGRDREASEVGRKLVTVRDVRPGGECRLAPGQTVAGFSTKSDDNAKFGNKVLLLSQVFEQMSE